MTRTGRVSSAHPAALVRIAALRRGVDQWALVIAETGERTRVIEARSFAAGRPRDVVAALEAGKVDRVIRLAPPARTTARIVAVPAGTPEETNAAALLLAEASLPEDIPRHRRAGGVLPDTSFDGQRAALLTAWRGVLAVDTTDEIEWDDQRWTTEIAALSFLRGRGSLAVAASRSEGAASILASGPTRAVARVLVESASDDPAWRVALGGLIAETCELVGAVPPGDLDLSRSLLLSADAMSLLRGRVQGIQTDPAWMEAYGLCVGAILASSDREAGGLALSSMTAEPPASRPPVMERASLWLSSPGNAFAVVALALLVVLLAPLGVASARYAILSAKSKGLDDQDRTRRDMEQRAALYKELGTARWPMTKLWADISSATPEGVHIEGLRLAPEQGLSLQGAAESPELLNILQSNLNATQLFDKLKIVRSETTATGVSFDLSAEVVGPHNAVAKPADDWGAKPLAVRLYGEGARNAPNDLSTPSNAEPERGDRGGRGAGRGGRNEEVGGARPAGKAIDLPGALSDEAIAALDFGKANLEWVKRKTAVGKATDASVKARLEDEMRKLDERRTKLKQSGGGT